MSPRLDAPRRTRHQSAGSSRAGRYPRRSSGAPRVRSDLRDRHGQQQLPPHRQLIPRTASIAVTVAIEPITVGVGDDVSIGLRTVSRRETGRNQSECYRDSGLPARPMARRLVVAVGTAAFPRRAERTRQVVELAARLGITMEIATETREAQLAYLVGSLGQDGFAVVDDGSRSIELVAKDAGDACVSSSPRWDTGSPTTRSLQRPRIRRPPSTPIGNNSSARRPGRRS